MVHRGEPNAQSRRQLHLDKVWWVSAHVSEQVMEYQVSGGDEVPVGQRGGQAFIISVHASERACEAMDRSPPQRRGKSLKIFYHIETK